MKHFPRLPTRFKMTSPVFEGIPKDSQPIPHLYSSAQANSAHVFRCGIGQINCAELVKRVTQMNDITKHAIVKKHNILTTNSARIT